MAHKPGEFSASYAIDSSLKQVWEGKRIKGKGKIKRKPVDFEGTVLNMYAVPGHYKAFDVIIILEGKEDELIRAEKFFLA